MKKQNRRTRWNGPGTRRRIDRFNVLATAVGCMLVIIALAALVGCVEEEVDNRLADMAKSTVEMQAQQNGKLLDANREVAAGAKDLVAKDAAARRDLIAVQKDLQTERSAIGQQRDTLDADRKQLHSERQRDSLSAAAIGLFAQVLLVSLPLGLIGWLLYVAYFRTVDDSTTGQIVLEQFVLENPVLLPDRRSSNHTVAEPTLRAEHVVPTIGND